MKALVIKVANFMTESLSCVWDVLIPLPVIRSFTTSLKSRLEWLGSSMVELSAVNRMVVGSSPTRASKDVIILLLIG